MDVYVRSAQVAPGSSTQTGNGVYVHAASSLPALLKPHRNSKSARFETYLFPNQKVVLSRRSAPDLGLCGTGWCECPQREGMLKCKSYGVEGVEGNKSTVLHNHAPPELMWRTVR